MDYAAYKLPKKEVLKWSLVFTALSLLIGYLFYGALPVGLLGIPALPVFIRQKTKEARERRRQELLVQFKDLILSYGNTLKAGYSIENGFREAYSDLKWQYSDDALIMEECRQIIGKLENKHGLEELITDLGVRSDVEEIRDFASVFSVAKKSGGNLPAIISDTGIKISDKLAVKEEIELMFASKCFEQKIMNCIPIFMMSYIGIGTPGYFAPLYGNVTGIAVMTASLILYAAAYFLAQRIMEVRI